MQQFSSALGKVKDIASLDLILPGALNASAEADSQKKNPKENAKTTPTTDARLEEYLKRGWIDSKVSPEFTKLPNELNKQMTRFILGRGEEPGSLLFRNGRDHSMEVQVINENLVGVTVRNREKDGSFAQEKMIFRRAEGSTQWELATTKEHEGLLCPLKKSTFERSLQADGAVAGRLSMMLDPAAVPARFVSADAVCNAKIDRLLERCNLSPGGSVFQLNQNGNTTGDYSITMLDANSIRIGFERRTISESGVASVEAKVETSFRRKADGKGWEHATSTSEGKGSGSVSSGALEKMLDQLGGNDTGPLVSESRDQKQKALDEFRNSLPLYRP